MLRSRSPGLLLGRGREGGVDHAQAQSELSVVDTDDHQAAGVSGIAFRGADWNRRPWMTGTAFDVWEIVAASRASASPRLCRGRESPTSGKPGGAIVAARA